MEYIIINRPKQKHIHYSIQSSSSTILIEVWTKSGVNQ